MEEPRVVAIIQARMGSSRLPGKVLMDIAGQPMIAWVVERARQAEEVHEVVVATTSDWTDDPLADYCQRQGYPVFRGSQFDVLDRYYQAARAYGAHIVVRITADCPLIDPQLIDLVVRSLLEESADFAANRLPPPWTRTYPIGLDVEVVTFAALDRAWREADKPHQREHVMPYLYEDPDRFSIRILDAHADYGSMRWTVDTPEDLEALRKIFAWFGQNRDFGWMQVLEVVDYHPELGQLNVEVEAKAYDDVDHRFNEHGFDPPTPSELLDEDPQRP